MLTSRSSVCMLATLLCCAARAQQPDSRPGSPPLAERAKTDLGFAQLPNGLAHKVVTVEGCENVALVLGIRAGYASDPPGEAGLGAALATALRIGLEKAKGAPELQVRLSATALCVGGTMPRARLEQALDLCAGWLAGEKPFDARTAEVAIAQARLVADDMAMVVPGPILESMARAHLGIAPVLPSGDPEQMAFEPKRLIARFGQLFVPARAFLVVVGGRDRGEVVAAIEAKLGPLAPSQEVLVPRAAEPARPAPGPDERENGKLDAPFATVAMRALTPDDPGFVPFLVAVEVLRVRAALAFRSIRGGEVRGRFPFVHYDAADGSPLVLLNRRGHNGDAADAPRAELRALLQRVRTEPPNRAEIGSAAIALANAYWLPPYSGGEDEMRAQPRVLMARAATLAAAWSNGWPADLTALVQNVDIGAVRERLQKLLAPDTLVWRTLVPAHPKGSETKR